MALLFSSAMNSRRYTVAAATPGTAWIELAAKLGLIPRGLKEAEALATLQKALAAGSIQTSLRGLGGSSDLLAALGGFGSTGLKALDLGGLAARLGEVGRLQTVADRWETVRGPIERYRILLGANSPEAVLPAAFRSGTPAIGLGNRDRWTDFWSRHAPPEGGRLDEIDLRTRGAALMALQGWMREHVVAADNSGGILDPSFLAEIFGVEIHAGYMWGSSLAGVAERAGFGAVAKVLWGLEKAGIELVQRLKGMEPASLAVHKYLAAAGLLGRTASPLALASLGPVLPMVVGAAPGVREALVKLGAAVASAGAEAPPPAAVTKALLDRLKGLDAALRGWPRLFDGPDRFLPGLQGLRPEDLPPEAIDQLVSLRPSLASLRLSERYRAWLDRLTEEEQGRVTGILDRFAEHEGWRSLTRSERLGVVALSGVNAEIGRNAPDAVRFFVPDAGAVAVTVQEPEGETAGIRLVGPVEGPAGGGTGLGRSFQNLVDEWVNPFVGPLASLIRGRGGRWGEIFGVPFERSRHSVWADIAADHGPHVTRLLLLEENQPRALVFPLWRGSEGADSTPVPVRLMVSPADGGAIDLELAGFDLHGRPSPLVMTRSRVAASDGVLFSETFLPGDASEFQLQLLGLHGRRTVLITGADGRMVLAMPDYPVDLAASAGRRFEDLAGVLSMVPAAVRGGIEREMRGIFREMAGLPAGDPRREAFVRIVEGSPHRTRGRILGYLLDRSATSEERALGAEVAFHRLYASWGEVTRFEGVAPSTWAALVRNPRTDHRLTAVLTVAESHEGIEENLARALDPKFLLGDGSWPTDTDIVVDVNLPSIAFVVARGLIEVVGEAVETVLPRWLTERINEIFAKPLFAAIAKRVWRVTVTEDRGPGEPAGVWTFRNRVRFGGEWERVGYRVDLAGDGSFVHDPTLDGIHPQMAARFGLDRLGAFRRIEPIRPDNPQVGRVLLLHGAQDQHLYLASVIPVDELGRTAEGLLPGLEGAHRILTDELSRRLADRARWPNPAEVPQWNRLRLAIQGPLDVAPEEFERLMAIFAERTLAQRAELGIERTVVEVPLTFTRQGLAEPQGARALVTIEDIGEVAEVRVRYFVRARGEGIEGEQTVLVEAPVLNRILTSSDNQLAREEWQAADIGISDKTPVDRRRAAARAAGATFVYDRATAYVAEAAGRVWTALGLEPPADRPLVDTDEIWLEPDGRFRIGKREPGQNEVGVAAFRTRVVLPNYPEGRSFVYVGHDPTHRTAPLGALAFPAARLGWLAIEYGRQNRMPPFYDANGSGAMMGLPEALIPRRPGMPVRVSTDEAAQEAWLTEAQVADVVTAMKAGRWEDIFVGDWRDEGGERRLYPTALLVGGTNQLSLLGSALIGGAMARAANEGGSFAAVLGGKGRGRARAGGTGITMYLYRLARSLRAQNAGSYLNLTGPDAIANMYGGIRLFLGMMDLGGAERMQREGMTTVTATSELDLLIAFLTALNDPANETPPAIAELREVPGLADLRPERVETTDPTDRDIGPAIEASRQRVVALGESQRVRYGAGHYDTADELGALVDGGTFSRIPGTAYGAVVGMGRLDGWPVAAIGAQMLSEWFMGTDGRPLRTMQIDTYDPLGRQKKTIVPAANPPMTLTPESAGALASFMEAVTAVAPWLPFVGDMGASGYDPRFVAASGRNGARLLSAMALHPAPRLLWTGPGKRVLGGMEVTIGITLNHTVRVRLEDGVVLDLGHPEQFADLGRIRSYADPDSVMAVLDPAGWKGIKFYKDTVDYVAGVLERERQMAAATARKMAETIVAKVVGWMSALPRANADGAFTGIVGTKDVRRVLAGEVDAWYRSDDFRVMRGESR